jgi:homoserine kinase
VPAVISGAGPGVLAFATSDDDQAALSKTAPEGWRAIPQRLGGPGARVLM